MSDDEPELNGERSGSHDWRLDASQFSSKRMTVEQPPALKNPLKRMGKERAINVYYKNLSEMLEGFTEMDAHHERLSKGQYRELKGEEEAAEDKEKKRVQIAIHLSNGANVCLFAIKVVVSVMSGSIAIIASALDSLLDLLSGFILWYTSHRMSKMDKVKYPIGKQRMQPLGIIVFASVMATLGFQVLLEAVRRLGGKDDSTSWNNWPLVVAVMIVVTAVKAGLMAFCLTFKNEIVRAYAQDHFFDVVTNSVGLAAYLFANWLAWWIDPVGAIILAIYTIVNWSKTVTENVNSLVGRTAPPEYLQQLTYLCWNHHKAIKQIDTVRAYTFGGHYFTEVDIVLPAGMPLQEAHDIGEALQFKLEALPEIERAFVHLDYEVSHRPEHDGLPSLSQREPDAWKENVVAEKAVELGT